MKGESEIFHCLRSHDWRAGLIPGFCAHTSRSNLLFILETGVMSISPKSVF
ncbi:hypothetical protein NDI43_17135 [Microcoleus vaginatus GB2-A3]